jgi:hypothetical protein
MEQPLQKNREEHISCCACKRTLLLTVMVETMEPPSKRPCEDNDTLVLTLALSGGYIVWLELQELQVVTPFPGKDFL